MNCPILPICVISGGSFGQNSNQNDEKIDNLANSALLRTCQSLDDLPLAVMSRGRSVRDPAKYPPGLIEEMEQIWRQMQRELTQLSSQSRHIIASKSGHLINEDEPELIVEGDPADGDAGTRADEALRLDFLNSIIGLLALPMIERN